MYPCYCAWGVREHCTGSASVSGVSVQDYVKWRGQLFHQFMRALVDDSHDVRSLANYLLADALSTKVCLSPLNPKSCTLLCTILD